MNYQFKVIQVLNFYKKRSLDNMRVPVLFFFFKQSSACCVVVRNETGFSFKMKVKKQIIKPNTIKSKDLQSVTDSFGENNPQFDQDFLSL